MSSKLRFVLCALALGVTALSSGCATIVKGTTQDIGISTDPTGAACELKKGGSMVGSVNPTPGTAQIKKGDGDVEVTCKKKGYSDTTGMLVSSLEGWTFGNILFGGVIGVVVDASSGALHNYQPEIFVKLAPEKFGSDVERLDFYEEWRKQVLQNSTKAKIAASKTCEKEKCDEIVKRIDRETELALAGIESNRNLKNTASVAASAAPPDRAPVQSGQAGPVTTVAATPSAADDGHWKPQAGERWKYQMLDGKRAVGTMIVEVTMISGNRVFERITKDGSPGFVAERMVRPELVTTEFLPSVQLPGGYRLFELSAYFPPQSELKPGALGNIPGQLDILAVGRRNLAWETRVVGIEKVKVPAGEFEAWKVEGKANEVTPHGPMIITSQVWYSTTSRRAVKMRLNFDSRVEVIKSDETLELTAYDRAQ
jgi:hypothetical protein